MAIPLLDLELDLVGFAFSNSSSNSVQDLHRQQKIQGAAISKSGEATSNKTTNPAKIPMTWARCHSKEALV